MNKKVTYVLLAVLILTGVVFFIQMQKLSAKARNEFFSLELPIITIFMLATGVTLAFPSLLGSGKSEKKEQTITGTESTETTEAEIQQINTFSTEKFQEGLHNLKTDSIEKRFWYFCEYFQLALACAYKVEDDKNLKVEYVYGIDMPESDKYISGQHSLAATALHSGNIEVIEEIPEHYFKIHSGLGESKPNRLFFLPVSNNLTYILELASFWQYDQEELNLMQESAQQALMVA